MGERSAGEDAHAKEANRHDQIVVGQCVAASTSSIFQRFVVAFQLFNCCITAPTSKTGKPVKQETQGAGADHQHEQVTNGPVARNPHKNLGNSKESDDSHNGDGGEVNEAHAVGRDE
jgi:hypothetical protein